jgi:hypothetical protein
MTVAFLFLLIIGFWNSISIGQVLKYIYIYENTQLFKNKIPCVYTASHIQLLDDGWLYEE